MIVESLRKAKENLNKESVSFIQVGANDGIVNDPVNGVFTTNDRGYFFEPFETSFKKLTANKREYINCKLLNKALLPDALVGMNKMMSLKCDKHQQGLSFIHDLNVTRNDRTVVVECVTVSDFLKSEGILELDMFICDAEGLDHLIVLDVIKTIKPKVIFFESFRRYDNNIEMKLETGSSVMIPNRSVVKTDLVKAGYTLVDLYEVYGGNCEDILATLDE